MIEQLTGLTLEQPFWLGFLVFTPAPLLLAVFSKRRGRKLNLLTGLLQILSLIILCVALAGPEFSNKTPAQKPWLILEDKSLSVKGQTFSVQDIPKYQRQYFAQTLLSDDPTDIQAQTRITPALRYLASQAEKIGAAVLITDGQFDDSPGPAANAVAQAFTKNKIPLFIVPLQTPPPDAKIGRFRAFRRDKQIRMDVSVESNAPLQKTLVVRRIKPTPKELYRQSIRLMGDQPLSLQLADNHPLGGSGVWEAQLLEKDAFPENNVLRAGVSSIRRIVALVADKSQLPELPSLAGLGAEWRKLTPKQAPSQMATWLDASVVLLLDPTGAMLTKKQQTALANYVQAGGALLMLGIGPADTPNDRNAPLNRILPLLADPFQRTPLDLTVILDASGSMATPPSNGLTEQLPFTLAAQATTALKAHLSDADSLRVIVFNNNPRLCYDSGKTAPDFSALAQILKAIRPTGPTHVQKALNMAIKTPPQGKKGLVILLSDLLTSDFPAKAVAKQFRKTGQELAIIAIGQSEDNAAASSLFKLAEMLKTPIILRKQLVGLDRLFARLCRNARGAVMDKGQFKVTSLQKNLTLPETLESIFVVSPTQGADVLARVSPSAQPILAQKKVGLGKSVSLAIPVNKELNPSLWTTEGKNRLNRGIQQMISNILPPAFDRRFDLSLLRNHQELEAAVHVSPDVPDRHNLGLILRIQPLAEAAKPISARLTQTGPGEFTATLPLGDHQDQLLAINLVDIATGRILSHQILAVQPPREFQHLGANAKTLQKLANETGGRIIEAEELPTEIAHTLKTARVPVWWIFLVGSILCMLAAWVSAKIHSRS